MKILMAPFNMANMPQLLCEELRRKGFHAKFVQYTSHGQRHRFGYSVDEYIDIYTEGKSYRTQLKTLKKYIDDGYDIFHFWNRSLLYTIQYTNLTGLDLVFLKTHNKRILHRFTGFDLRRPSLDLELNPYSCFRYGYTHNFDETRQQRYLDFISQYVDIFIVQDPEMHQFWPDAKLVPRGLNLNNWPFVGISPTDEPLIVHAPSNGEVKGTSIILKAIEELLSENFKFKFKLIQGMNHQQAIEWYKRADIIIDQILIGATGVLTLEAWALGKPVVVYLPEHLWKPFYGEIPAASANPDNIKQVLRELITDYERRKSLSHAGRKIVEKHHNISDIANSLIDIYQDILDKPARLPTNTTDIDYFIFQLDGAPRKNPHKWFASLRTKIMKIADFLSPKTPLIIKKIFVKPYYWIIKKL